MIDHVPTYENFLVEKIASSFLAREVKRKAKFKAIGKVKNKARQLAWRRATKPLRAKLKSVRADGTARVSKLMEKKKKLIAMRKSALDHNNHDNARRLSEDIDKINIELSKVRNATHDHINRLEKQIDVVNTRYAKASKAAKGAKKRVTGRL